MIAVRKIKHFFEITPITKLYSWIFLLILGAVVGYYIGIAVQKERYASFLKSFRNIREKTEKYNFISPLVGGSSAPATDVGIYSDLRDTLTN